MDIKIKNAGSGSDIGAHVDTNNQLHVFAVETDVVQNATAKGNSYNVGTGIIALTSTTASGLLYIKNDLAPVNGEAGLVIDEITVTINNLGTIASGALADIVVIRNPTTGTLISVAKAVTYNSNRNFGSSNTLSEVTIYEGVEASTVTDGTSFSLARQNPATSVTYPVNIVMPKGSSMAITLDTQTTAGTTSATISVNTHRKDGGNN